MPLTRTRDINRPDTGGDFHEDRGVDYPRAGVDGSRSRAASRPQGLRFVDTTQISSVSGTRRTTCPTTASSRRSRRNSPVFARFLFGQAGQRLHYAGALSRDDPQGAQGISSSSAREFAASAGQRPSSRQRGESSRPISGRWAAIRRSISSTASADHRRRHPRARRRRPADARPRDMIDRLYQRNAGSKPLVEHELFHLMHHRTIPDCEPVWCNLWEEAARDRTSPRSSILEPVDAALGLTVPAPIRPSRGSAPQKAVCAVRERLNSTNPDDYSVTVLRQQEDLRLPCAHGLLCRASRRQRCGQDANAEAVGGADAQGSARVGRAVPCPFGRLPHCQGLIVL